MSLFELAFIVAAFLCSLVAGFLFAFAVVAMPGLRSLRDREFIRAFQVMDRVIQNNQPLFVLMWVGSVVALIAATVLGLGRLDPVGRVLIVVAALVYLVGVQLPTVTINIPLNNAIQAFDVDAAGESGPRAAREGFESRWNRWNAIRTVLACLTSLLLLMILSGS